MPPRANRIYIVPDGRLMIARKEVFASMTEPAWTLIPYLQPRPDCLFVDQCLYLENGKLYALDFSDILRNPIPIVRDSGWTWKDVVDTGRDGSVNGVSPREALPRLNENRW